MRNKSLSQKTADTIYEMILAGEDLHPGDRLPGENELSERLGVSRGTLREAIRSLASQGVLEVYRGKGTFIAEENRPFGDFGLGQLEQFRARLKDLFEARLLFEPRTAELACRRATEEELAEILRLGGEVLALILADRDRTERDQAFHRAIVAASHNDFLLRLVPVIDHAIEDAIRFHAAGEMLAGDEMARDTLRDHGMLMDFLRERNGPGASHAMAVHICDTIRVLKLNDGDEPIV